MVYQETSFCTNLLKFHFDLKFNSRILIFCCRKSGKNVKNAFYLVSWPVLGGWKYKIQQFLKKFSIFNNISVQQYKKLWIGGFLARDFNFFLRYIFPKISLFLIQHVYSENYKVFTTPCRFKTTLWKSLIF